MRLKMNKFYISGLINYFALLCVTRDKEVLVFDIEIYDIKM